MIAPWPHLVLAGVAGACIGSYVGTAALRATKGLQATFGRSRCDACSRPLGFASTAPVVSYVMLRGACAGCGRRIDPTHLVGEVGGAVVGVVSAAVGLSAPGALTAALGFVLLGAAIVDLKTRRLPDLLTAAAAALCAALAFGRGGENLVVGVVAAVVACLVLEVVRRGFIRMRGEPGLGFGDVKLIAALALALGTATPWAVAAAAALGLAVVVVSKPRDGRIAFGPAIALCGWVGVAAGEGSLWPGV